MYVTTSSDAVHVDRLVAFDPEAAGGGFLVGIDGMFYPNQNEIENGNAWTSYAKASISDGKSYAFVSAIGEKRSAEVRSSGRIDFTGIGSVAIHVPFSLDIIGDGNAESFVGIGLEPNGPWASSAEIINDYLGKSGELVLNLENTLEGPRSVAFYGRAQVYAIGSVVPEPDTYALIAFGFALTVARVRARRRAGR